MHKVPVCLIAFGLAVAVASGCGQAADLTGQLVPGGWARPIRVPDAAPPPEPAVATPPRAVERERHRARPPTSHHRHAAPPPPPSDGKIRF